MPAAATAAAKVTGVPARSSSRSAWTAFARVISCRRAAAAASGTGLSGRIGFGLLPAAAAVIVWFEGGDDLVQVRGDLLVHLGDASVAGGFGGGNELQGGLALGVRWCAGWAGRAGSPPPAVRFAGPDIIVYSSAGKRSAGHLSRQGPEVMRWCVCEAGKTHARGSAPDYRYYAAAKDRIDGKRAAISEARKIIRQAVHILAELGDGALAPA